MKKKSGSRPARPKPVALSQPVPSSGDGGFESPPRLVRLNKFLAEHGVASRRRCDELIGEGKVSVDGEPTNELGLKIDPDRQVVEVDGFVFKSKPVRKRYYLLNKPSGVVCTNESRETRPRAVDLITDPFKGRIFSVGRLDEESKGLLMLTNDGDFAHRIQHPKYGVEKTYLVKVTGEIDDETLKQIREGVHLSEGRTAGSRIIVHERGRDFSLLSITIREGMNREIRRVFARFGFKVSDLKRIRIGSLTDRGLKPGRWRELVRGEIESLLAGEKPPESRARGDLHDGGGERGGSRDRDGRRDRAGGRDRSGGRDRTGGRDKNADPRRPRGEAPLGRPKPPKNRGYARHLVQGGRAVDRRPDAPLSFAERERANASPEPVARGGKLHGRVSLRPKGPSAPKARAGTKGGPRTARKSGTAPKPKVGRKNRGAR